MRIDAPMIDLKTILKIIARNCLKNCALDWLLNLSKIYLPFISVQLLPGLSPIALIAMRLNTVTLAQSGRTSHFVVPVHMAMQMLSEMHSMLIRYTEIIDLGDGPTMLCFGLKTATNLLLKDFTPQHRGVYKIAAISDDRSVQEFFSYLYFHLLAGANQMKT